MADINVNALKGKAIKSVQKGYTQSGASNVDVTINAVDPAKCLFFIASQDGRAYAVLLNSTTVRLPASAVTQYVTWQVVEFY